jgi:hypothetical protein
VGGPGKCLNCSDMFFQLCERGCAVLVPQNQGVVVASTGELLPIEAPLKAADFLLMSGESGNVVILNSHVPV